MISTQYNTLIAYEEVEPQVLGSVRLPRRHGYYEFSSTSPPTIYFLEAEERFGGLDLEYYRQAMTNKDFLVFLDFIGGETVDFQPSDFEVYYPEDEE